MLAFTHTPTHYVANGGPPGMLIGLRGLRRLVRSAVNVAVRYSPRWIDPEILSPEASPENRKGTEFPGLRISLRSLTWFPSTTPEISWTENSLSWIPSIQLPSCEIDHRWLLLLLK